MSDLTASTARRWALPFHEIALFAAIVLVFVLTATIDPNHTYLRQFSASSIIVLRNAAILGIVALGAAVVIISGGIDLSVGSTIAFSATTSGLILVMFTGPKDVRVEHVGPLGVACALAGGLIAGLLVGTLHTWLITSVRLPAFVATLASLVGLRSFSRAMCEFVTKACRGSQFQQIDISTPFFLDMKRNLVWIAVAVFLMLAVVTWLMLSRTVLGRHIYAVGGNEQAARLSGVRTENVKWFAYCFSGVTASIAGILMMADVSVAQPVNMARGFELNAIAAAVVGGCSLQGGVGTVLGVSLGALFLRLVIDAVAKLIKAGADVYEGMIVGIVVVLAVTLTQVRQLFGSGGSFFAGARGVAAIPTLAIALGLLAMMGSVNVPYVKDHSVGFGLVVGVVALLLLSLIKVLEVSRQNRIR